MEIIEIFILALSGVCVGLVSGMFGIGGGTIIVPLLFFLLKNDFLAADIDESLIGQKVIFTSLSVVIFTTLVSSFGHWRKKAVSYAKFGNLSVGLVLGSIIGANFLLNINTDLLKFVWGFCFLAIAYSFGFKKHFFQRLNKYIAKVPLAVLGVGVSWLSVLLGVAGGMFNVGILKGRGLSMHEAVGTSSWGSFLVCTLSIVTLIVVSFINGESFLQYIHVPFFLSIFIVASLFSNLGVYIAHRLSELVLKRTFAVYLAIIACYFIFGDSV